VADNPSYVIPLIMLASVSVACVSAFFSRRASKVAADAAKSTLYLKFQEQYASREMRHDLRNLRSWREVHGGDFAHKWAKLHEQNDADVSHISLVQLPISTRTVCSPRSWLAALQTIQARICGSMLSSLWRSNCSAITRNRSLMPYAN
jgi:hypothetical protein